MPYTIAASEDRKYIILRIEGEITAASIMKMIVEAHAFGDQNHISRYLVDATDARNTSTISENYQFAYENMKMTPGLNLLARISMLVSPEDHSHDFVETVTQNSGFITRLFRNREEAIEYLIH